MSDSGSGPLSFHVMAKPAGPACNLRCEYCFYLEKDALFPEVEQYRMSDEILEAYIRQNYESQDPSLPEYLFAWQGGEPTLLGIDFFRRAVELEKKYCPAGKKFSNTLQTNGILLDDEWCEFLARNDFLVGLSLDGPREIHDRYRVDRGGNPTFDRVMKALRRLQKHGTEFNILACVNRESSERPVDVYRFFKENGARFIQFIPIVERIPGKDAEELGLELALPPSLDAEEAASSVTPWSVEPEAYGHFLNTIFDEWVRKDVGEMFVMTFEWSLTAYMGLPAASCIFATRCGTGVILEHNGDVYSCDHFMYPAYRLGNILEDDLGAMVRSEKQIEFGALKETALPGYCTECEVLAACRGACPKHRFVMSPYDEPGLNYLCEGYKDYFNHIKPYLHAMAKLYMEDRPISEIMDQTIIVVPKAGGDGRWTGKS